MENFSLGIDLGTTSVKVYLFDCHTNAVIKAIRREHNATVENVDHVDFDEQDPALIMATVESCITEIGNDFLHGVKVVSITGQMHGVMFWNKFNKLSNCKLSKELSYKESISTLVTWQDQRCNDEFLAQLPTSPSGCKVSTGFGCATIFWLNHFKLDLIKMYEFAGTVMDYFVFWMCGLEKTVMSTHNANSWGYYNEEDNSWETEILQLAGFPIHLLPEVEKPNSIAGHLSHSWCGIQKGTLVSIGLADFQCTVYASIGNAISSAVLNIGTSSQLAFITSEQLSNLKLLKSHYPTVSIASYFDGKFLIFVASLTGGNALQEFVNMLSSWITDLDLVCSNQDDLYTKIEALATDSDNCTVVIHPTLFGERHLPRVKARVDDITKGALSLGQVARALYLGIIRNIRGLMPETVFHTGCIKELVVTGNTILNSQLLQRLAGEMFALPIRTEVIGDAAFGATLRGALLYKAQPFCSLA